MASMALNTNVMLVCWFLERFVQNCKRIVSSDWDTNNILIMLVGNEMLQFTPSMPRER